MSDAVFLVQDSGELLEMRSTPYESEDLLQRLIADYPSILAGDAMQPDRPRRWLMLTRELGVPDDEGAARWAIDHLLVDQDGIPTLVEVKRAVDTRSRREVVAQMLDYAANGAAYWSVDEIRARFERSCALRNVEAEAQLSQFLGIEATPEAFWQTIDLNLRAGKVRMVFVADTIRPELKRIVEFLNGQMSPAEVLAVEIQQYTGARMRMLVPRLVGQTAEAQRQKSQTPNIRPTIDEWFSTQRERLSEPEMTALLAMFEWLKSRGEVGTTSSQKPSIFVKIQAGSLSHYAFFLKANGRATTALGWLMDKPPFADLTLRTELLERLKRIPGMQTSVNAINGEPAIAYTDLISPEIRADLFEIWSWVIEQLKTHQSN